MPPTRNVVSFCIWLLYFYPMPMHRLKERKWHPCWVRWHRSENSLIHATKRGGNEEVRQAFHAYAYSGRRSTVTMESRVTNHSGWPAGNAVRGCPSKTPQMVGYLPPFQLCPLGPVSQCAQLKTSCSTTYAHQPSVQTIRAPVGKRLLRSPRYVAPLNCFSL